MDGCGVNVRWPIVALDVGGTAIKAVILGDNGEIQSRHHFDTHRENGPDAVVATVLRTVDALITLTGGEARGVGLAVPGLVDEVNGIGIFSENIGWVDIPFRDLVEQRTGLAVGFGHDVRTGGLAEKASGAGLSAENMLFMPIGTGISGAMFIESQLNRNMYAGEIGHIDVGSGETCMCGSVGCLETVATGPSIATRFQRSTGIQVAGAREVLDRLQAGDGDAAAVWDDAIEALAVALATYTTLLAPDLIVLGGGLSNAGAALIDPLRARLHDRLTWQQKPRLERAEYGGYSAAFGAGILAADALEQRTITHRPIPPLSASAS